MRSMIISIYLFIFRIVYQLFCFLPIQEKTLFWMSYGENAMPIHLRLNQRNNQQKQVLIFDERYMRATDCWNVSRKIAYHPMRLITISYHLATSRHVFLDNYIGEFSVSSTRKNTRRIQLWHAAGTLKQFGLTSSKTRSMSTSTQKRFRRVYQEYGDFIVPGMRCAEQFMMPHDLERSHFKAFGMPRTDYWFDEEQRKQKTVELRKQYAKTDRRILLYAPTYREYKETEDHTIQQFEKLAQAGWTILVKLHPTIQALSTYRSSHIHLVDDTYSINDYLLITDVLVTDYSSIPFESCLLNIPAFLYTPDIDTYRQLPGLVDQYPKPLPVRQTERMEQLMDWIMSETILEECRQHMEEFQTSWYDHPPGQAVERIVDHYYGDI
ncbi:CDP-glycerol--glycerophosphate glycerophosphotransferase [Exiguobacterium sp. Leaf187]|nr:MULTISPECIES: CDP-glycerol glycerophosphotransferase family protein [unclassified Exiguobacterium]KQS21667.1 CDP-glycerol--glycerophosphate glycerophosphotransferase [Exiguobacterium sp. Leaf187]KTR25700.1 CDP-glycerol:glycerophosphate glycerophosphotransferase [Exiguobacterium indicum]NTY08554.1 CDP-glycerol glycerophosphotransferase family protein [Exiguobacterium sp. JMULE1]